MVGRHAKGNAGVADLALGTNEPLGERGLRDEERTRDLTGLEARNLAQRQGDARFGREGRMAAREDEAQAFVGNRAHVVLLLGSKLLEAREELGLARQRPFAADAIDRTVPRGRDDPRSRVARGAVLRPPFERARERFLDSILGELKVPENTDEDRDRTSPLLAEDRVDG